MAEWTHTHHLALLHPEANKVLLLDGQLPHFAPKDGFFAEVAESVTWLKDTLGVEAHALRPLRRWRDEHEKRADTLLLLEALALPENFKGDWVGLEALEALSSLTADYRALLCAVLGEEGGLEPSHPQQPAWVKRGGVAALAELATAALRGLGYRVEEPFEQMKQWHISSVGRVATDKGTVYLKTLPPLFRREAAVTRRLAELFPVQVPEVVAEAPDRGWFLTADFGGEAAKDTAARAEAARAFAEVQLVSLEHLPSLRRVGCLDRSLGDLSERLEAIVGHDDVQHHLSEEERSKAEELVPRWRADLATLAACGVPDTLVHGDLHFGNVVLRSGTPLFFDWTDACVSHPLVDLFNLVVYIEDADEKAFLEAAYLEPWREAFPTANIERALALTQVWAPLFYVDSYRVILEALEPSARWQFGGVQAHYLKFALAAVERSGA